MTHPILDTPKWISVQKFNREKFIALNSKLKNENASTVCIEANCPNRYECFAKGTATFMILGNQCTRNCQYCNVKKKKDCKKDEKSIEISPKKCAQLVSKLNLKYVVITSVTRDDLNDGGASVFVDCVTEIRKKENKNNENINQKENEKIEDFKERVKIELLIPDFLGDFDALKKVVNSDIDVLNHNIEVAKDLFYLRPEGNYDRSLQLLANVKKINPNRITKSGLMIGLGEEIDQIIQTLKDLKKVKCDIITIGQYLAPSPKHAPIKKFYTPEEFEHLKKIAQEMGFRQVFSGPMVRSSYNAASAFN